MKRFEFEKLEKVLISYGVIIFGILVSLIGFSLLTNVDGMLIFINTGIIGVLLFSFAKNEHFYSLFALLGVFSLAVLIGILGEVALGIITSFIFIGAVVVALIYYIAGNLKTLLIILISALLAITVVSTIVMFAQTTAWGATRPEFGVVFIGVAISLIGTLLTILFMKSNLTNAEILKQYDCSILNKKEKEKIVLKEEVEEKEKPELKEK